MENDLGTWNKLRIYRAEISEFKDTIREQKNQLNEKNQVIDEQKSELAEKDQVIDEKDLEINILSDQNNKLIEQLRKAGLEPAI